MHPVTLSRILLARLGPCAKKFIKCSVKCWANFIDLRGIFTRVCIDSEAEGPYGQFNFASAKPRQIWVAAGVGITPFMTRMQALALHGSGKPVDLFYATRALPAPAKQKLQQLARSAQVRLHLVDSGVDPRLNGARICAAVPE